MIAAHAALIGAQSAPPLPYDAEAEYLESAGTQYIDTGINADGSLGYELTAQATQSTTQRIGAIDIARLVRHHVSLPEAGSNNYLSVCGFGSLTNYTANLRADLTTHTITLNASTGAWLIDNATIYTFGAQTFDCGMGWYIFARNSDQGVTGATMRVLALRMTYGGVLVRDFIPVRVGSGSSAVGYLYDRVSGVLFGNAGTGAFAVGPDK